MVSGRLWVAAVVAGVTGFAASAQAALIDTFQIEQSASVNSSDTSDSNTADNSMLGGERDLRLEWTGGADTVEDVFVFINNEGNDEYVHAAFRGEADVALEYDGDDGDASAGAFDTAGLGSESLNAGGEDRFRVDGVSSGAPIDLNFEVWSNAGDDMSSASLTVPGGTSDGSFELEFSSFVGDADFNDVSALRVSYSSPQNLSFSMGEISTVVIPAPAALPGGLALMGMMGVTRYRRRRAA